MKYRLKGTSRLSSSIGAMDPFKVEIKAPSPRDAMDQHRARLYNAGRDCILFKTCEVRQGKAWVNVPMMQALELE